MNGGRDCVPAVGHQVRRIGLEIWSPPRDNNDHSMVVNIGSVMRANERFSTKEVALLAGLSEKAIRHEMARDIARPRRVRVGKAMRRDLDARDVFYLRLVSALPVSLTPEDRRDLYVLIRRRLSKRGRWEATLRRLRLRGDVGVEIDPGEVKRDVERRVNVFVRGRRRVSSDPNVVGGAPVFAGTRIPVRHVGLLARRQIPLEEILEDYPALDSRDVEFARLFVELRPDPGRPPKSLELRRTGG
jgi:uncharacterized protein (DUF433 family)